MSNSVIKQKPLVAQTSAADKTGSAIDVRGIKNPTFVLHARTVTDDTLDAKVQGSHDGISDWFDIDGVTFTQVSAGATANEQKPVDSDNPGVTIPNFVRGVLDAGGSISALDAEIVMLYDQGPLGPRHEFEELGG